MIDTAFLCFFADEGRVCTGWALIGSVIKKGLDSGNSVYFSVTVLMVL